MKITQQKGRKFRQTVITNFYKKSDNDHVPIEKKWLKIKDVDYKWYNFKKKMRDAGFVKEGQVDYAGYMAYIKEVDDNIDFLVKTTIG